jgi:3-isopropylmalate dehydrogenase
MFGDILTDLGAALQGGLGVAASANLHPGRVSLFEPVHGSAPDKAGRGIANPIGAIATVALMLDYLGHPEAARRVAIEEVCRASETTVDLGGSLSTIEAGSAICERLRAAGEENSSIGAGPGGSIGRCFSNQPSTGFPG